MNKYEETKRRENNYKRIKKIKEAKGITLIALVITIVILIILATVTINMAFGENGLVKYAEEARDKTANSTTAEAEGINSMVDQFANIMAEDSEIPLPPEDTTSPTVEIVVVGTTENSIEITVNAIDDSGEIETYKYYLNGTLKDTLSTNSYTFTRLTSGTSYTIKVEAYDKEGNVGADTKQKATEISESTSYVGYYADIDGNGSVDGVIYADLAIGGSGIWNPSGETSLNSYGAYTIPKGSNFKKYEICKTNHTDDFGTNDVIKVTNPSGNERFYVMALDNVDSSYLCWYDDAYGNMSDYTSITSTAFGSGKQNTKNMIAKWNEGLYGEKNDGSYNDMWGVSTVQTKINANPAWYVPSREEWSAFGGELGITTSNYLNKKLNHSYWSSSQCNDSTTWRATIDGGYMYPCHTTDGNFVRLGSTF